MMAQVTVRFDADLVAVTRNAAGEVVAGSTSDAVATHDVWTFSRHVRASDPNWLLVTKDETDADVACGPVSRRDGSDSGCSCSSRCPPVSLGRESCRESGWQSV